MKEIWKDIAGFEGWYQVSNMGRVRSLDREIVFNNGNSDHAIMIKKGKILSITKQTQGYSQVGLCKNGTQKSYRLNRLVAIAFIQNPMQKPEVNHIDGNKDNNRVDNLELVTSKENQQHAIKTGLADRSKKRKPILQIDKNGNVIAEFDSIKQAAQKLGFSKGNICYACKGHRNRKAYGYFWRYKFE